MPRILLIEDSPTQALEIRLILESDGFEVDVVPYLSEGLDLVSRKQFDAITLDLMLPDASGLDGLERMLGAGPQAAIVVLTAHANEATAFAALEKGADDYLPKGMLEPTLLVRTMRYAIERHRNKMKLAAVTEELRAKNDELAKLNEQKNNFLGIAAHDLRNPLGVILGHCELLLAGDAGEINQDQAEILEVITSSVDFMRGLINDLLDFSLIQSGALRLDLHQDDLAALLRKNVAFNRVLAEKKDISLALHVDATLEPMVFDRRKIDQVLNNLLSNAIKYSHRGTTVAVHLMREGDTAILAVKDQGVGIPESEIHAIFRPFQKTSARSTAGERSTGLGLAIVRNIVEGHGGRIWAESEVGQGSTFYVALPIR
jgi:signal transduction histidine kinase